jgi:CIC family chloride channel protein
MKWSSLSERIVHSQTFLVGGLAVLVGLATGVGVWAFKFLFNLLRNFMFGNVAGLLAPMGRWTIALVPAAGGILVGLLAQSLIGNEKLHGTAGVMQSVALAGGRLRYQKAPVKTAAAILSIGMGASVGPEDPSVQIGANFGSMLGQWFRMSDERIRMLVAAGAASAIAAAFNAPIAGVFFALELILGEISGNSLGLILVAAVTSALFTQAVSGSSPAFQVPAYTFRSGWELPFYLVLGLIAGPVSALYIRAIYKIQDLYQHWDVPKWVMTGSAGLLLGITGIFLPQVLGVGYETIGEVLNKTDLTLWLLLALLIAKIVLTPVSLGGGFVGGVFAPALFIGATLGGAFGLLAAALFPGLGLTPAAFAMVGMAAVLAGSVHAPLTAVILLFEMTNDYRIILPLMFAVAVSLLISQRIQKDSVYALGLARLGIRLDRGRDVEVMGAITVGDAMHAGSESLPETASLEQAAEVLARSHHHGLPVVDTDGLLTGVLTIGDIEQAASAKTVGDACTRAVDVAFPDETLNMALRRMSRRDVGHLPVVSRENPRKLVGILGRTDVIHAYDIALTRRVTQRHQEYAVRLDALTPDRVDVTDVTIERGSLCAGKKMSEIPFPRDCVIASVRRGRQVFIPRGNTVLKSGDVLVVVAQGSAREEVLQLCRKAFGET